MRPNGFFFTPDMYNHYPKISTRVYINRFKEAFKTLSTADQKWFTKHPQFSHVLHMPLDESRKCMPIWMLLVRAVDTGDRTQLWFVVNGVPIRYSIREHGILSGLNCDNYPGNLETLGGKVFIRKYFNGKIPKLMDVEAMVKKMHKTDPDKLTMTVLLFLSLVIKKQSREEETVTEFLARAVDDLSLCESFPWGRYTFEDCLSNVYKSIDKYKAGSSGGTKTDVLPGFIFPLEVLAFECCDVLKAVYRESVEAPRDDCPLLCQAKFKKCGQKGFTLNNLHDCLGESTAIHSTLVREEEDDFLSPSSLYVNNPIVDGWNKIISEGGTISWDDMYRSDIESRALPYVSIGVGEDDPFEQATSETPQGETPLGETQVKTAKKGKARKARKAQPIVEEPSAETDFQLLQEAIVRVEKNMEDGFAAMSTKVGDLDTRLKVVEDKMGKMDFDVVGAENEEEDGEEDEKDVEEGSEEDGEGDGEEEGEETVLEGVEEEEKVEEEKAEEEKVEEKNEEEKLEEASVGEEDGNENVRLKRNRKDSRYLKTPFRRTRQRVG